MLQIGKKAPDFKLFDQNNKAHKLSNYKGSWVVIYFYPKDDTPGCTKEACSFRDNLPKLGKLGAQVFGISVDSVSRHAKFANKYNLPFTLLADEEKQVVEKFEVWGKKQFMGREYMGTLRTTFIINPEGKIAKIYEQVKPENHGEEVLADLKLLQKTKK